MPLLAVLGLVHLGFALTLLILRQTGRCDDGVVVLPAVQDLAAVGRGFARLSLVEDGAGHPTAVAVSPAASRVENSWRNVPPPQVRCGVEMLYMSTFFGRPNLPQVNEKKQNFYDGTSRAIGVQVDSDVAINRRAEMLSKKFVLVGAMAAAGTVGSAHATFMDFTVDQTSITAGTTATALGLSLGAPQFVADKITGFYNERLTINSVGGAFDTAAYSYMNAFSANEGTTPPVPNGSLAGTTYNLYAVFTSSGFFDGGTTFTGLTGSFKFYLDPLKDTTLALGTTGSDPIARGNIGDDYELASASVLSFGTGNNVDPGSYKLIFSNFTLTSPNGPQFFVAPVDFYMNVTVTGDFDQFNVVFDPDTGLATVSPTGDVSAVFEQVPEPGSLALAGLALLGIGSIRRRFMK